MTNAPTYRYLLCDLLTDEIVTTLDLSGVEFGRRISRAESFRGTLTVADARGAEVAKLVRRYAGRAALWVLRDQAIWWGGILWSAQPKEDARGAITVDLNGATFDSYAHRRQLYASLAFAQEDQGVIIPELWRTIQADPSGDIGVVAEDQPTGILRDRAYLLTEQQWVGKLIEDMGDIIDGPEHTIDTYLDGDGNRVKRLRLAATLGSTAPAFVFQRAGVQSGRVVSWSEMVSGSDGGTVFRVRGDAREAATDVETEAGALPELSEVVERTDLLDLGWPRLDFVQDRPGAIETDTLNGYAQGLAAERGGSMPTRGYTVEVGNSGWSPNNLGDMVRIKLNDLWHDNTDETVRPVGCRVTPAEKGSAEKITLLLAEEAS